MNNTAWVVITGMIFSVLAVAAMLVGMYREIVRRINKLCVAQPVSDSDLDAAIEATRDVVRRQADELAQRIIELSGGVLRNELGPLHEAFNALVGAAPDARAIAQYDALVAAGEALYARTGHGTDKRQRAQWNATVEAWRPAARDSVVGEPPL